MKDMDSLASDVGAFWDRKLAEAATRDAKLRLHWWNDPVTIRHLNHIVCGESIEGLHAGFHRRIGDYLRSTGVPNPKAISVGSGTGMKELWLLQTGAVASIDCYELASENVEVGRRLAAEHGMTGRLRWHRADVFAEDLPGDYDLVYWNNALHHMSDTPSAIAWSRDRLRWGGLFAFDDYVGPNRFQFSDDLLVRVNAALTLLPDRYLRKPNNPQELVARKIGRWSAEKVAADDPSEAVDSGRILPAIRSVFPKHQIIPTGGSIYFLALNDAFHNFVTDEDQLVLRGLLLIDHLLTERGETPYAVGFGFKARPGPAGEPDKGDAVVPSVLADPGFQGTPPGPCKLSSKQLEMAMLNYYQRQLESYRRRGGLPWVLRPGAWLARANRNSLRKALSDHGPTG